VHVVYGIVGLKTHAKMTLVVRREGAGIRLYVHLSTGNYNRVTSRMYTDIGLLTCDPDIARDVLDLFNGLTGYSGKTEYKDLIVAPATGAWQVLPQARRAGSQRKHCRDLRRRSLLGACEAVLFLRTAGRKSSGSAAPI
jgi:polyphosphate kinase